VREGGRGGEGVKDAVFDLNVGAEGGGHEGD